MKNFASIFGWILLAAVLAVPSFLFYNWWSANKAKEAQLAASQQGVPRDFFPGGEKTAREETPAAASQPLVTPDQSGDPAADQAPVAEAAVPGKQPAPPVRPGDAAEPEAGSASEQPAEEPAAGESPAQPGKEGAAGADGQNAQAGENENAAGADAAEAGASYFNPKTERNPFLTPDDYAKMRAEEARRRREARQRAQAARQTPREVLIESRMTIQGIVGSNVIINGEMYSQGDTVLGAKIVRIGPNYIIGEHKGRRFRKYMQ